MTSDDIYDIDSPPTPRSATVGTDTIGKSITCICSIELSLVANAIFYVAKIILHLFIFFRLYSVLISLRHKLEGNWKLGRMDHCAI